MELTTCSGSGVALAVPTAFRLSLASAPGQTVQQLDASTLSISRIISVLLLISYTVYIVFQTRNHHGIYTAVFEHDEHRDHDRHKDETKAKLTMTECVVALAIAIALVTLIAITLVSQIEHIIASSSVSDPFIGLILVPLV